MKEPQWTNDMVHRLIQSYKESECLWNIRIENYKDRKKRADAVKNICSNLGITSGQFAKKVHNLRNQFNAESKKMSKRHEESGSGGPAKWEYFNSLRFLENIIVSKPGFGNNIKRETSSTEYTIICDNTQSTELEHIPDDNKGRVLASKAVTIEVERLDEADLMEVCQNEEQSKNHLEGGQSRSVIYLANPPEPSPAKRPRRQDDSMAEENQTTEKDDYELFGSFIASEMRNLSSAASRRKMKMRILQVILEIGLEEDEMGSQL